MRANLTVVTSPRNSDTCSSRLYLLCSFLLFPFHPRCTGAPYRIFLLFLLWRPCHFYLVVIDQQQVFKSGSIKAKSFLYRCCKYVEEVLPSLKFLHSKTDKITAHGEFFFKSYEIKPK